MAGAKLSTLRCGGLIAVAVAVSAIGLVYALSQVSKAARVIRSNISSSGERIYHMPGQRYYDKTRMLHRARGGRCRLAKSEGLSGGCPHLARRLSGPALECMRECTHLVKA
jgi:hypothetical protein